MWLLGGQVLSLRRLRDGMVLGLPLPSVARATALDRLVQAQHLAALGLLPVPIDERVWRGLPSARTTLIDSPPVPTAAFGAGVG